MILLAGHFLFETKSLLEVFGSSYSCFAPLPSPRKRRCTIPNAHIHLHTSNPLLLGAYLYLASSSWTEALELGALCCQNGGVQESDWWGIWHGVASSRALVFVAGLMKLTKQGGIGVGQALLDSDPNRQLLLLGFRTCRATPSFPSKWLLEFSWLSCGSPYLESCWNSVFGGTYKGSTWFIVPFGAFAYLLVHKIYGPHFVLEHAYFWSRVICSWWVCEAWPDPFFSSFHRAYHCSIFNVYLPALWLVVLLLILSWKLGADWCGRSQRWHGWQVMHSQRLCCLPCFGFLLTCIL